MKPFIYFAIVSVLLSSYSCKKCKNPTYVPRAKIVTECFGNYKPDAYWIYLNKDSTKRDSMWVDNFRTIPARSKQFDCTYSDDKILFDLHYSYLDNKEKLAFNLRYNGHDLYTNIIEADNNYSVESFFSILARDDSASFYRNREEKAYPVLYGYQININGSNHVLDKVFIVPNKAILAPYYGMLQYYTNNDTFTLIKFSKI